MSWLHRSLVAFDQFVNVLTGGKNDETISARSYRAAQRGNKLGKFMCWWLDKIQPNHGKLAAEGDLKRAKDVEQTEQDAIHGPS